MGWSQKLGLNKAKKQLKRSASQLSNTLGIDSVLHGTGLDKVGAEVNRALENTQNLLGLNKVGEQLTKASTTTANIYDKAAGVADKILGPTLGGLLIGNPITDKIGLTELRPTAEGGIVRNPLPTTQTPTDIIDTQQKAALDALAKLNLDNAPDVLAGGTSQVLFGKKKRKAVAATPAIATQLGL